MESLERTTQRYTSGLESFLSVLDAQRAVYAAEDQLAQSERSTAISLVAVYKALGGGWALDATAAASPRAAKSARATTTKPDGQAPR